MANSGVEQLIQDMKKLSEEQDTADLCFVIEEDPADSNETRIFAHRLIVAARCKKFQKRGEITRVPGVSVIRLNHVNPDVFRQFISYVYTGRAQLDRVFEMMTLAHDMGVDELKSACEDKVISSLTVENACKHLITALELGPKCAASFVDRCITFVGENAAECVKSTAFLGLSKDGLIKLISSDYFCLEEEDVWRCVLEWAKHQAGVTQKTALWSEEERVRVCQHLSGVMGFVRLLLIDSKFFAEEVEPTGAVPMELLLERYRHAALNSQKGGIPQPNQPLPVGGPGNGASNENDKRLQPRLSVPLNLFNGSQILKQDKTHLQSVLNNWFGVAKQNWKLIYRASNHGFSATSFHNICDGIAPLFVVALGHRGEISGGFTDVAWTKSNRKGTYIHSEKAFLFALNPSGSESPLKFDILKKPYAICYHPDCGPVFGAGADFFISTDCQMYPDSYSNLPHSYSGPSASNQIMFGDYNFTLVDYEVFTLGGGAENGNGVKSS